MLLQKHYDKLKFVINHGSDEQLRDIGRQMCIRDSI